MKPLVDLPGVGLNFQDHYLHFATYRAKPNVESFDDFVRGDKETQDKVFAQWNLNGMGPLATNGIEAGVKVRPDAKELEEFKSWPFPEFISGWDSYFKDKPDKPVMHYSVSFYIVFHARSKYTDKKPGHRGLVRVSRTSQKTLRLALTSSLCSDHMLMPPGKFFTMFHFLEYPFSRGFTHITSPSAYDAPDFDAGFMNDKRDMIPMVWGYIKSRETARRMDAYAGEVTGMHPFYAYDSPAKAKDMDLATTNAYAGPNHITANIQHGSWAVHEDAGKPPEPNMMNSNQVTIREDLVYSREDLLAIEEWVKRHCETTWHSLGTCSMGPKEGNSVIKHGVLDERLNVHGVKGLKVADLSVCPDNVGCNTYSTALLIGEKCAMLTGEDLGYSGRALDMKVPDYQVPGYVPTPLPCC